ncbi:MAG: magnesium transporter [Methanomassiliicoccales archaeon]
MASTERIRSFFGRNKSVFTLGFIGLVISSIGDLAAGATLGFMTDTLALLPGLMILIPPAIGMRGNIFGALGSRLGTAMHVGTFEMSLKRGSMLRQNLEASLLLTMVMSFLMGVMAKVISVALGVNSISIEDFVFISVLGGALAGLVIVLINILVASIGYRRGWDIDNISAPIITAAGDIVTLPMLFIAALIVTGSLSPFLSSYVLVFSLLFLALAVYLAYRAYKMKKSETKRIIMQSAPVLSICIILDIAAGLTIENQIEGLVTLPALLVLIPPFLEDANALGGILTSRLSSMLHMGLLEPTRAPNRVTWENFAIIYIFSIWVFILVGVTAHFVSVLLGLSSPGLLEMVLLSMSAGLITVTILNFISYYVAIYTYKFALDPDDHSIPLTSSAIDAVGAISLMVMIIILNLA